MTVRPVPKVRLPQDHARVRAGAYPPAGDQLDALWKGFAAVLRQAQDERSAGDPDLVAAEEMLAAIKAVKTTFPKEKPE